MIVWRKLSIAALLALALGGAAMCLGAAEPRETYAAPSGTCDGFPRLDIGTARGMCAGLVLGPTKANDTRPISLPRSLVQLDNEAWLVSDLGSWTRPVGAVWRLQVGPGRTTTVESVLQRLNLPHAMARGPDGLIYVGEMSRIFRFNPDADDPVDTVETVISGLPDNQLHEHRHPLSKFVFAADGALLVNVGAPSDQCLDEQGRPLGETCIESEGEDATAGIRRYASIGPGKWDSAYTVHARGLRNSVALAVHSSGTVVQAENSYDFPERWVPFEEINVIERGKHYGWPYCFDMTSRSPGWRSSNTMDCMSDAHTKPAILLPPHAAPLDMLWYEGNMFPWLQGRLLMTWHGHRSVGGRIATFAVDARGVPVPDMSPRFPIYGGRSRSYSAGPAASPIVLTPGWGLVRGRRPQGSPVGLEVAKDGSIWTTDDRAGMIIRLSEDCSDCVTN